MKITTRGRYAVMAMVSLAASSRGNPVPIQTIAKRESIPEPYLQQLFLRLRKQPFVEAAKCLGLPAWAIVLRHILPNALVPLITFFPFSLVGAIGSLAALDYLGFGLPPPTPSWGELLQQAQQFRWAWWLILYPSLALFVVMLLGVMIGEGVRNAFDPRRSSVLE